MDTSSLFIRLEIKEEKKKKKQILGLITLSILFT